jgi:hypothetical protein
VTNNCHPCARAILLPMCQSVHGDGASAPADLIWRMLPNGAAEVNQGVKSKEAGLESADDCSGAGGRRVPRRCDESSKPALAAPAQRGFAATFLIPSGYCSTVSMSQSTHMSFHALTGC